MNETKNLELARMALERSSLPRIEESHEPDDDLQNALQLMTWVGQSIAEPLSIGGKPQNEFTHTIRKYSRVHKLMALVLSLVVLSSGGGFAAYSFLFEQSLLRDDFNSGWFDSSKWLPPPDIIKEGGVRAEKGHVRLINRGYLVPRREFSEPIQIDFEWKWNQLGLNPLYSDVMTVALRTDGNAREFSHEVQAGFLVQFNAWGSFIQIATPDGELLAITEKFETLKIHAMPAEQWHKIRVIDDGKSIRASFSAQGNSDDALEKMVLVYEYEAAPKGKRFAIYNRELVAFPHESCIRNLTVKQLK